MGGERAGRDIVPEDRRRKQVRREREEPLRMVGPAVEPTRGPQRRQWNVGDAAANVFIRGIGQEDFAAGTEPGVGLYVDGVYVGRTMGAPRRGRVIVPGPARRHPDLDLDGAAQAPAHHRRIGFLSNLGHAAPPAE